MNGNVIGNIVSNGFNLDYNGKTMQIEVYEQLIEQLQQENKQLKKELECTIGIVEHNRLINEKNKEIRQLKDNWNKLKEYIHNFPSIKYGSIEKIDNIRLSGKLLREDYLLDKMKELEQGSDK